MRITQFVRRHRAALVAAAIMCASLFAVVSTYPVVSSTSDEWAHFGAGLQWWQSGDYRIEYQHPPLARIAVAFVPHLDGFPPLGPEAGPLLVAPNYVTLSRLGILPFYLLSLIIIWLWACRLWGHRAGLAVLALYASVPTVLAHAGVATTDMPFTSMFVVCLYVMWRWLEEPSSWKWTVGLGLAWGLTTATKFTGLMFIPACLVATLVLRWRLPAPSEGPLPWRAMLRGVLVAIPIAALVVWSTYRFSVGTVESLPGWNTLHSWASSGTAFDTCFPPDSATRGLGDTLRSTPLPAPEFFAGLIQFCATSRHGRETFLFGDTSTTGFLLYFPTAFVLKATLALLVALGIACFVAWRKRRHITWRDAMPAVCALVVLLLVLPSHVQLGVRYALAMFPLLAFPAGAALAWLANRGVRGRVVALAVIALSVATPVLAWPAYLAHFNLLAGPRPNHILNDSNYDWGQDLYRLRDAVKRRNIDKLHLAYFGSANFCSELGDRVSWLEPGARASGWIAISDMYLLGIVPVLNHPPPPCVNNHVNFVNAEQKPAEGYAWLRELEPVERVGTISLFYIKP